METQIKRDTMGEKIKSYRIRKGGLRGMTINLPIVYTDDLDLKPGDRLDIYREGERLIITPRRDADPRREEL